MVAQVNPGELMKKWFHSTLPLLVVTDYSLAACREAGRHNDSIRQADSRPTRCHEHGRPFELSTLTGSDCSLLAGILFADISALSRNRGEPDGLGSERRFGQTAWRPAIMRDDITDKEAPIEMQGKDNEQIIREFYEAFNNHEVDRVPEFVAPNCDWVDVPTGTHVSGPEGVRGFWENVYRAFPDYKAEITNVVAAGDWVIAEFIGRGIHSGMYTMPNGNQLPPTGHRVAVEMCEIRMLRNGKIVAGRGYYDLNTMLNQLGLMPQQRKAA